MSNTPAMMTAMPMPMRRVIGSPKMTRDGIDPEQIYEDKASGKQDARPQLTVRLKALRSGDTLIARKLDRLSRDLRHLVNTVHDLTKRGVGHKVLTGQGAAIDATTASGKLVFGIFATLAEFERELISERTKVGLASARARGRKGGRPYKVTPAKAPVVLQPLRITTPTATDLPNRALHSACYRTGLAGHSTRAR